ncbi:ABC transporter ATP-binding protein [Tianweitania populi]|uniref:ABC transporter n=1 Tax=Tianweitania populi TaxID=1607949 RepID=A0A8J3DRP8_9HYPH|nr:ATP-binding cassette domain-containing protein [Tianweitania populi]GHD22696.1 ABC transporter [Tianweitania populi]
MLPLVVEALDVRFPGLALPALDIPTLQLKAGERLALTGPSGSGKTTLINILTGLERVPHNRAAKSSVRWGDTDLASLSERRRDQWRAANVGLVMQDFHLFPGLSALENVLLPQRLAHLRLPAGMYDDALRLLSQVGIERLDQAVETLSRGQMQRVAVARALLGRPGLIVADEPTASLDAQSGAAVAELLLDLAAEIGATLIVASHDHRLVDRLDRVLRLEGGRVVQPELAAA